MKQLSNHVARATTLALLLCVFSSFSTATAQTIITGTVIDSRTNEPLPGAEARALGESVLTDAFGGFELKVVVADGRQVLLTIQKDGYQAYEDELTVGSSGYRNAGRIELIPSGSVDQTISDELIPTITLSSDDLEGGSGGVQNISGVLTASRDVFTSAAAFVFGPARFNLRGYDAKYTSVLMNGIPVNDLESGGVFWSNWGGLNDVMRNRTNAIGLAATPFYFGGVGGASTIDTRASTQRRQLRVSYSLSNRTYRNRLMATYSTGMLESGWAVSLSASRRWAEEGFAEGTPYDAYAYFLSVDRKLGSNQTLNLTTYGSPIRRGKITGATQEMYDLAGTNYYNANWGFQNGEKRNARIQDIHQPVAILRHDLDLSSSLKLITSVGYQWGRTGNTALDWYDAPDPRPNYYRYLPSFFEGEQADRIAELWRTDPNVRQVNWDQLYNINYNSFGEAIDYKEDGTSEVVQGRRSQYIVEDRRTDVTRLSFNTNVEAYLTDRISLEGGLTYQQQRTENYKVVSDLLGGDFYVDVDRFAEFDSSGAFVQNFVDQPDRAVREGDRWGYDFDYQIRQAQAWAQTEIKLDRFDFFLGAQGGFSNFWRDGKVANGKFPDDSEGESERSNFTEYGAKAGITYKLDGRNYFLLNGMYQVRAPYVRDAFVSPRTRNQLVEGLTPEKVAGVEGGYLLRAPSFKARAIGYYTEFRDQIYNRSFFLDNAIRTEDGTRGGFVNYIMQGIDSRHAGVELAVEAKITTSLTASAVAAIGQYVYTNRPSATIYLDQLAEQLSERTVYIKNFRIAGTPQQAYTFGLNYNSPRYWFLNINFNFFDQSYLDFYPERRTTDAVSYSPDPQVIQEVVPPDSPLWNEIIDQEKAPSAFTIDFFGGKSWKVSSDFFIYLHVGVSNVLDKQDFITGGYEQFRFDFEEKNVDRFPTNYFYSFGRNYFINLAFRFN